MEDEGMPTFLGLDQGEGDVDIAILSLPYELTTSYGQGTALGQERRFLSNPFWNGVNGISRW